MDSQNQKPIETEATSASPEQAPRLGGEGSFEAFDAAKKAAEKQASYMLEMLQIDPRPPVEVMNARRRMVWRAHQKVLNLGIPKQGSAIDTK